MAKMENYTTNINHCAANVFFKLTEVYNVYTSVYYYIMSSNQSFQILVQGCIYMSCSQEVKFMLNL